MSTRPFMFKRFEGWGITCDSCGLVWLPVKGMDGSRCPHCAPASSERAAAIEECARLCEAKAEKRKTPQAYALSIYLAGQIRALASPSSSPGPRATGESAPRSGHPATVYCTGIGCAGECARERGQSPSPTGDTSARQPMRLDAVQEVADLALRNLSPFARGAELVELARVSVRAALARYWQLASPSVPEAPRTEPERCVHCGMVRPCQSEQMILAAVAGDRAPVPEAEPREARTPLSRLLGAMPDLPAPEEPPGTCLNPDHVDLLETHPRLPTCIAWRPSETTTPNREEP